jgi:exopolysaccharide/PEP-CTERM locus tyrosine autokinase
MSLIDQAAKRLEELRRAGIAVPERSETPSPGLSPERIPTPEAVAAAAARARVESPGAPTLEPRPAVTASSPAVRNAPSFDENGPRAVLDLPGLKSRGFITPDAPRSQIADEFRVIKRPIIRNAMGRGATKVRNGNLVMVTSALPGEGKTFTSINLAMSLAMEVDTTVLLVDGDVAHPALPRILEIPSSPGLLELLTTDRVDISSALVRTNVPNLAVLPAGALQPRATELLASAQMGHMLDELSSRYPDRIIVFDSPPLLATTEARVLATHMGQVVMVVAADSTRHNALALALSTIEACEVVFMVLNKADQTDVGLYYYGYAADDRSA